MNRKPKFEAKELNVSSWVRGLIQNIGREEVFLSFASPLVKDAGLTEY